VKPLQSVLFLLPLLAIPASATVTVSSPTPNSTVMNPVHYVASASSTCSKGVASMGVYINNKLAYSVKSASLDTNLSMALGYEHTVVQEWDNCGASSYTTVNLNVISNQPTVSIAAKSSTISAGSGDQVTVNASNATSVVVTGSDGSSYPLSTTGGSFTVTPSSTTTYTAEASNANGTATSQASVTVIPASSLNAVSHVILMLQENHSFDNYFGMLNPYRHGLGWDIGSDGKTYIVDGVDDKLNTISNPDDEGTSYPLFKLRTTCIDDDSSGWKESYQDVARYNHTTTRPIPMNGFVHVAEGYSAGCLKSGTCSGQYTDTTGERAMGYYDQTFLNYYYYMASQFALSDRWFSPISSASVPNRITTFSGGTTQGLVHPPGYYDHLPQLNLNNIFQELQTAGISWKIYYTVTQGYCLAGTPCGTGKGNLPDTSFLGFTYSTKFVYMNSTQAACTGTTKPSSVVGDTSNSYCIDPNHVAPLSQYYTDVKNNTLPAFAFIESGSALNDEHPGSGQSVLQGQAQVAKIVNSLMTSPSWGSSIFFLAYDEGGGPYDHVPPVPGHSNDFTSASLKSIQDIGTIAVNPDSYNPCIPANGIPTTHCDLNSSDPGYNSADAPAQYGFAAQLGFRVPNIIVSPFTRKHYVGHLPMDHTAVIKFVENRFLGNSVHLTARDAAQPDLLDFFDFSGKPWSTPPTPPAPASNTSLGYNACNASLMGP
jgi:phospholipase C